MNLFTYPRRMSCNINPSKRTKRKPVRKSPTTSATIAKAGTYQNRKNMAKIKKPRNHGKTWELDDMLDLADWYSAGKSFYLMARSLGRTESACQIRIRVVIIAASMVQHGNCNSTLMHLERKTQTQQKENKQ